MSISLETLHVTNEQVNPRILTSVYFNGTQREKASRLKNRLVYDYELEFYTESEGAIDLNGTLYPVKKNDVVFRRPGDLNQSIMPYSCHLVVFDMLNNTGKEDCEYTVGTIQEVSQPYYMNPILNAIPTILSPPFAEKYEYWFQRIFNEFIKQNAGSHLLIKSIILQIIHQLHEDHIVHQSSKDVPSSAHSKMIKNTVTCIQANLEESWNLAKLAQISGMSTSYFHSVFTKVMQQTPNQYINELRLEKAKKMLLTTDASILDIAMRCGFGSSAYFGFLFKKKTGVSPIHFRKIYSNPYF
ncbi:helix-turn-helix transcriptional regulator [Paenibacillus sp. JSM ZJ436]|uniref:Transcriptional regulator, AraC family n=1 Tax=Paenibacillus algicola TaxID=2565926 RepID=A0A4P8XN01_9BACL|nr:AraC family transcriptional regulator [Paenibacillus algicola]QCT03645.1 transcriptional regulator, AraC family [Paenibacillus algicola]